MTRLDVTNLNGLLIDLPELLKTVYTYSCHIHFDRLGQEIRLALAVGF